MIYSVVLLDGNELHCLSLEEVQDLFFKRQINQDSLVCSAENSQWQMLKRIFDLSQWIPANNEPQNHQTDFYPQTNNPFNQTATEEPDQNGYQNPFLKVAADNQNINPTPQNHSFEDLNENYQPVTFNQFPPNQTNNQNSSYKQNAQNGYSQNNQSETYYQAETTQTNYNFQNNQAKFAPSKYNNPGNSYKLSSGAPNERRSGAKAAAVFLVINAIFYLVFNLTGSALGVKDQTEANMKMVEAIGKSVIPLIIDLLLALSLYRLDNVESTRKWVLARTYIGFVVFGLVLPIGLIGSGNFFVGAFLIAASFFYFISLILVLHGKNSPPKSRVMVGIGTFAIYFLVMLGTLGLGTIGNIMPDLAKLKVQNAALQKYKIEGKEYQDQRTGAKVVLPEGWSMISLDNPYIKSPEARMVAIDSAGNRLTMLEVVPVPGNLDMKRTNAAMILDKIADEVVKSLKQDASQRGGFGNSNFFNEITRLNIYIGKHPAKLLVFDQTTDGEKLKGHLIITNDELTFYVLHSWCPAEEYQQAQNDFTFFEKNFVVPEQINSTFTQTAENQKK